jgi:hypothetical protein
MTLRSLVDGPARAGEKGTPCVLAGPRSGGKSVAAPQLSEGSRRDLDGFRGHYRVRGYDRLEIDIG